MVIRLECIKGQDIFTPLERVLGQIGAEGAG